MLSELTMDEINKICNKLDNKKNIIKLLKLEYQLQYMYIQYIETRNKIILNGLYSSKVEEKLEKKLDKYCLINEKKITKIWVKISRKEKEIYLRLRRIYFHFPLSIYSGTEKYYEEYEEYFTNFNMEDVKSIQYILYIRIKFKNF